MISLNSYQLKLIALFTMTVDHIGVILFPDELLLRIIGRLAFIIYSYLIVEGYRHTRNVNAYLGKLLLFAFISEIPYDLAFNNSFFSFTSQNVFFTLFLGLLSIVIMHRKIVADVFLNRFLKVSVLSIILLSSILLKVDYSIFGVLQIIVLGLSSIRKYIKVILIVMINFLYSYFWNFPVQMFCVLGLVPIFYYNKLQGKKTGIFFYLYYIIHLLFLLLIRKYT